MKTQLYIFTVLFSLFLTLDSHASPECGEETAGRNRLSYCIYRSPEANARNVVYYLHGHGGHEAIWGEREDFRMIEKLWANSGKSVPTIIALSFGKHWFLSDEDGWWAKSYFASFTEEAMPLVEAKLGWTVSDRSVFGESMGGFNATQLYLKTQGLFSRAAIVCPAILSLSPQASKKEIEAFINRHQPYGSRKLIEKWQGKMVDSFSKLEVWQRHDPMRLALTMGPSSMPAYIMSEVQDPFAFFEGTNNFVQSLLAQKAPVIWEPISAPTHCTQTPDSIERLASFLVGQ